MRALIACAAMCCALGSADAGPKDQPPEVKLQLGHYVSKARGIGLVVDRTHHEARVRFDGTKTVLHLDPQPAPERTDYIKSIGHVVLQVWNDGHTVVFVQGATDGIVVVRDGDADPL